MRSASCTRFQLHCRLHRVKGDCTCDCSAATSSNKSVIIPTFTMVAVANSVKLAGGVPVYADCAGDNINPGLAEVEA